MRKFYCNNSNRGGATCCHWLLAFLVLAPIARAEDDNTVIIYGRRPEERRGRVTGNSVLITPEEPTRFDSVTHLRRESSVITPETSRISPSGFVVPSIRGQDVKLTDVYLEDIQLQDPYSGLPLIEDLDLRAFGQMEVHQGLPPPEVPGFNPIGTIRYRFRPLPGNSLKQGVTAGQPYGSSLWTLGGVKGDGDANDFRIYARGHQSSGRYAFYDDNGTPYNEEDDSIAQRDNNDQRSQQALLTFNRDVDAWSLRSISRFYRAKRGMPSRGGVRESRSREGAAGEMGFVRGSYSLKNAVGFDEVKVGPSFTAIRDRREVDDDGQSFLNTTSYSNLQVSTDKVGLSARGQRSTVSLFLNAEQADTKVSNILGEREAVAVKRSTTQGSIGVAFYPTPEVALEAKGTARQQRDRNSEASGSAVVVGEADVSNHQSFARGVGVSVGYQPIDWLGAYFQFGISNRLPGLIEEFGDGGSIRPNQELKSEDIKHREIGISTPRPIWGWRSGLSAYEDVTTDKIVFVPVMASATKAINVRATRVRGFDWRNEFETESHTHFLLALTRLLPYDETRDQHKLLPGIPERIVVAEVAQRLDEWTFRWLSRYRSEVYRDLSNSVRLPGAVIQDLSVDWLMRNQSPLTEFGLGISVRNVFNVMSVPVIAPDTPVNTGRTAYSDVSGDPLPGRQWIFNLSATI